MAYNTKEILKDIDNNPISQYYNPELDRYEPLEGVSGANKVVVFGTDGTETNISLQPIIDKLSQLTGTVVDEEVRKSSEIVRKANETYRISEEDLRLASEIIRISEENTRKLNESGRKSSEVVRKDNELIRVSSENDRLEVEIDRVSEEVIRKNSEIDRVNLFNDVETKVGEGYFKGDKGDRGTDGVVTEIGGNYAFEIRADGNLYVLYGDGGTAPDFKINPSGELIFTI